MRSNPLPAPETAAPEAATPPLGAVAQGRQWLKNVDFGHLLGQLRRPVRDLGAQVAGRVRRLTPAQQAVGGAVLAAGLGWLAVRGRRDAGAKPWAAYQSKFASKPFKGWGKPRYASS